MRYGRSASASRFPRLREELVDGRDFSFSVTNVNGEPGVIVNLDTQVTAVIALGVRAGRIDLIHAIGNPAKLQHVGTTGPRRTPTDEHQR